jgi:tetratricopeptide (TPR) repeat protein
MRIDFADIQQKVKIYHSVSRFEAAEKILLSALDEYGSMANLHNLLGVTYHKQSKFADAIVQFTKALKVNQNFVEAGLNLSATFCDLGKYDDAKRIFSEILAQTKQPDLILGRLANHHAECGHLYAQTNLPLEAIQEYKKALSLYEKLPDVKIALGQMYFKTNQLERALFEFQDTTRLFPSEIESHIWLGICLWKLNRRDAAIKCWEQALKIDENYSIANSYLALVQKNTIKFNQNRQMKV